MTPTPEQVFTQILLTGGEVNVEFIPSDETKLPPHITKGKTKLTYGLNTPKPIPDLKTTSAGVEATLSFGGKPFFTFIPWSTVTAIYDYNGRGLGFGPKVPNPKARKGGFEVC